MTTTPSDFQPPLPPDPPPPIPETTPPSSSSIGALCQNLDYSNYQQQQQQMNSNVVYISPMTSGSFVLPCYDSSNEFNTTCLPLTSSSSLITNGDVDQLNEQYRYNHNDNHYWHFVNTMNTVQYSSVVNDEIKVPFVHMNHNLIDKSFDHHSSINVKEDDQINESLLTKCDHIVSHDSLSFDGTNCCSANDIHNDDDLFKDKKADHSVHRFGLNHTKKLLKQEKVGALAESDFESWKNNNDFTKNNNDDDDDVDDVEKKKAAIDDYSLKRNIIETLTIKKKNFFCELCNCFCYNETSFNAHVIGKRHRKMSRLKVLESNEQQRRSTDKRCEKFEECKKAKNYFMSNDDNNNVDTINGVDRYLTQKQSNSKRSVAYNFNNHRYNYDGMIKRPRFHDEDNDNDDDEKLYPNCNQPSSSSSKRLINNFDERSTNMSRFFGQKSLKQVCADIERSSCNSTSNDYIRRNDDVTLLDNSFLINDNMINNQQFFNLPQQQQQQQQQRVNSQRQISNKEAFEKFRLRSLNDDDFHKNQNHDRHSAVFLSKNFHNQHQTYSHNDASEKKATSVIINKPDSGMPNFPVFHSLLQALVKIATTNNDPDAKKVATILNRILIKTDKFQVKK